MTPEDCFQRAFDALQKAGWRPRITSAGNAVAYCGLHHDRRPSLKVKQTEVGALVTCFGRCTRDSVHGKLGLTSRDLIAVKRAKHWPAPQEVASYVYDDPLGCPIAEKVRFEPKAFRWRRPGAARYGLLRGVELPIFNQSYLIDAKRVFLTEGEKAVRRLAGLGLAATCPPNGASSWCSLWSSQLWRGGAHDVYILADNDSAGDAHAERVAAALHGYADLPSLPPDAEPPWDSWPMAQPGDPEVQPLRVKVVRLSGLPAGGDVDDYLNQGHTREDLLACVDATPWWTPGLLARQRQQRSRELTRNRVRRWRTRRQSLAVTKEVRSRDSM